MREIGIREIARLANVSLRTVDRALHGRGRINESTRKQILEIAKTMGYRPNLAAELSSAIRADPRNVRYW